MRTVTGLCARRWIKNTKSGTQPRTHGCRQAAARWGHTSTLQECEHESIGEFRPHARDAWAGIWDFLLPDSRDPPPPNPSSFHCTHTHTLMRKICKPDSDMKGHGWELRLSSSPRRCKTGVPYGPLLRGIAEREVSHRQVDGLQGQLPADVFHIAGQLMEQIGLYSTENRSETDGQTEFCASGASVQSSLGPISRNIKTSDCSNEWHGLSASTPPPQSRTMGAAT